MNEIQLLVISLAASVVVWFANWYVRTKGKTIPEAALTIGVYIASGVLAVAWGDRVTFPQVPPIGDDPVAWVNAAYTWMVYGVEIVGGYVALAALIYQAFLKSLLEKGLPSLIRRARSHYFPG